jgi:SAM-dependent methyltransferase
LGSRQEREASDVTPADKSVLARMQEMTRPLEVEPWPHSGSRDFPNHLYQWEGFAPPPEDGAEPYSLQWFLAIEYERHVRHARWIPHLFEFGRHRGETLVGLGNSLGTDWLQYARHGARVIACSPIAAELALIRRNFELRGLNGRFVHTEATWLPLAAASADVVCINGLLHEAPEPDAVVAEVYRILKPGGKVVAVAPAKYGIDFYRRFFPWSVGMSGWLRGSPWHSTEADVAGAVRSFSRRRLKKLFHQFGDHRVHQRQLRRREAPWVLRVLPRKLLERWFGRFLILKAFKPVTAVTPRRAAA